MERSLAEVLIELTLRCNIHCLHCGSSCEKSPVDNELTIDQWKAVIEGLADMHVGKVVYSGGETTLKRGFDSLIRLSGELGVKHGFITNGYAIGEDVFEAMDEHKPFAVGVSIDGLRATHNLIRGDDHSWAYALDTVFRVLAMGVQVCVVTTVSRMNLKDLPTMAQFFAGCGVDSWQLQIAMPSGRMKSQRASILYESEFEALCKDIESFRIRYPHLHIKAADCFGFAPVDSIRPGAWHGCTAGISSMGITSRGDVIPCLSLRDGRSCGNVLQHSVADIWNNSEGFFNRKLTSDAIGNNCIGCKYAYICRGGCASLSHSHSNQFHNAPYCYYRTFNTQLKETL